MKYERLTERDEFGNADVIDVDEVALYSHLTFADMTRVTEALNRLAELEDKIERRELVELPKGAVVLIPKRAEEMRLANEERKQAVKEFAERVKMAFSYEFDELIPSTMADKIDELAKEVCGGMNMDDKQKQIAEMAKDIYTTGVAIDGTDIAYGVFDNDDHFHRMANALYAAGYRKQSDTAREILQKLIYNITVNNTNDGYLSESIDYSSTIDDIKELAAQYGVEVEE